MKGFQMVLNNGTPSFRGSALASLPAVPPLGVVFEPSCRIHSLESCFDQSEFDQCSRLFTAASKRGQVHQGRVVAPCIGSTLSGEARDNSDWLRCTFSEFCSALNLLSERDVFVACNQMCHLLCLAHDQFGDVEAGGKMITTD